MMEYSHKYSLSHLMNLIIMNRQQQMNIDSKRTTATSPHNKQQNCSSFILNLFALDKVQKLNKMILYRKGGQILSVFRLHA